MQPATESRPARDAAPWDRAAFVEEFGLAWELAGAGRMDGRIIGYLIITNVPHVSSAELAKALRVSAGSISLATRRLAETGWIQRKAVPGERGHFFAVEDDVWGGFLAGERRYLRRQEELAARGLELLGPGDEAPRRRLELMRDYIGWLITSHRKTLEEWNEYRERARDETVSRGEPVPEAAEEPEAGADVFPAALDPVLAQRLLPDALWEAAAPLLPSPAARPQGGGTRPADERAALTAVIYVLTSGCGWQQLPPVFGVSPATAHRRFTAWGRADVWDRWLHAVVERGGAAADTEWCAEITESATRRRQGARRPPT